MLAYLELTKKGMGSIDQFSSLISNIIPLGTSYDDAVKMITSWAIGHLSRKSYIMKGTWQNFLHFINQLP